MSLDERFGELMSAARQGDEGAITALYTDLNPKLARYLAARVPQEADDLCSEVWLQVARRLPSFEGDERAWFGFVFLVARRLVNDHWKRRRRRRTDPVAPEDLVDEPSAVDVEALGLGALATAEAIKFVNEHLSGDQADVLLLRVVAGLDVDEVASVTGKRPGTVRVVQHRALRRLAAGLELSAAARGSGESDPTLEAGLT